jgi:hypothetical protein
MAVCQYVRDEVMDDRSAEQMRAKMEWEAASEKLGNLLVPPLSGLPRATPENLRACFDQLQANLDALRETYGVPPHKARR